MATIDVKDAAGSTVAIEKPLVPGRAAATASRPVVLSNEDAAYLEGIETLIGSTNALLTTQNGYLDGLETLITATNAALAAATPAGESHIGSFGGNTSYIDVLLTLGTSAQVSGNLIADTQVITNAMRINDATGILQSVHMLDEDDQGVALDLIFLSANNTMGTENAAVSVSDTNARDILGAVSIVSGDYVDLGSCKVSTKSGLALVVKPASCTRNLYVAAVTRGAPTYTASGIRLRLGFLQD